MRCGSRESIPPDRIEQSLDGHELVPAEKKGRKDSPLLATAQLERAFPGLGFERAENAKPEKFCLTRVA